MRILIVGDSPVLHTGYGRVIRELAHGLMLAGHSIRVSGWGHDASVQFPYPIDPFPTRDENRGDGDSAARALVDSMNRHSIQLLLTVGDPWMFEGVPGLPRPAGMRWLAYFPVDGTPLPSHWRDWVRAVDVPVVFCQFTRHVVNEGCGVDPRVILHGVDTLVFRPADRRDSKLQVLGEADSFVVGCVAANHQRKNLPALIDAFALFSRDKPDAILYFHSPITGHWDLGELAERAGIEPRTRFTLGLRQSAGLDDVTLAVVYNSFDVLALPSMAEGFGLPLLEAQACGTPAVATDFSACPELLPDPCQRVRVLTTLTMARNLKQAVVDVDDFSARLDLLYRDADLRRRLSLAGRALAEQCTWEAAVGRFVSLIGGL